MSEQTTMKVMSKRTNKVKKLDKEIVRYELRAESTGKEDTIVWTSTRPFDDVDTRQIIDFVRKKDQTSIDEYMRKEAAIDAEKKKPKDQETLDAVNPVTGGRIKDKDPMKENLVGLRKPVKLLRKK